MGLRSVDGIPSCSLRLHHKDEGGFTVAAMYLYLVFMKHLLKVVPEAESSLRGVRKDGQTCDRWCHGSHEPIMLFANKIVLHRQLRSWDSTFFFSFFLYMHEPEYTLEKDKKSEGRERNELLCVKSCACLGYAPGAKNHGALKAQQS